MMHYFKNVVYGSIGHGYSKNSVTYYALCGEKITAPKSNNSYEKTDCEQCLRILLIKENDRVAKIAERLRQVELMEIPPKIPVETAAKETPKLPSGPPFFF